MKRNLFPILIGVILITGLVLASCSKETVAGTVYAPTLTVSVTSVAAANAGGAYSFTYSVGNPLKDGEIYCRADVEWISDLDWSSSEGTVSFNVAKNAVGDPRTGTVSIFYSSSYGVVSKAVVVAQNTGIVPQLTVQPIVTVTDAKGGSYSFTYSVTDPVDGGEIVCDSDCMWITDFDSSAEGTVGFTVGRKYGDAVRSGTITVRYVYSDGEVQDYVTVIQTYGSAIQGDGDVSEAVGTYTVSARIWNTSGSSTYALKDYTWTMKLFEYTGTENYDLYVDGWIYTLEGRYDQTQGHISSLGAYYYSDGTIVIPSQITPLMTLMYDGDDAYILNIGFTPCVAYDSTTGFQYDPNWPSITFTPTGDGTWESDYGIIAAACDMELISTYDYVVDAAAPTIKLTKTSSSTSSATPAGQTAPTFNTDEYEY